MHGHGGVESSLDTTASALSLWPDASPKVKGAIVVAYPDNFVAVAPSGGVKAKIGSDHHHALERSAVQGVLPRGSGRSLPCGDGDGATLPSGETMIGVAVCLVCAAEPIVGDTNGEAMALGCSRTP